VIDTGFQAVINCRRKKIMNAGMINSRFEINFMFTER